MNQFIQFILSRRSIRKFTDQPVSDEDLHEILQCALYAPTGRNLQETRFIAIQNSNVLRQLSELVRNIFLSMPLVEGRYYNSAILNSRSHPHYDYSFHAPLVVIAVAPQNSNNGMADSANAIQNMYLAATALGLGACWVNQLHWLTGNPSLRKFLYQYGLDKDDCIFGSIAIGHPSVPAPQAAPRKENRVVYVKQAGEHFEKRIR
jgi:nitroreductase